MTVISNGKLKKKAEKDRIKRKLVLFNQGIDTLYFKARQLKKLHEIQKTILANCAYHEKEMEMQFAKIQEFAEQKELDTIGAIWQKRNELGRELIEGVDELLKD